MDHLNKSINTSLKSVNSPLVENVLKLAFILYLPQLAPVLPQGIIEFFSNPLLKFFLFFLVGWINTKDTSISLIAALLLVIIVNFVAGRGLLEMFKMEQDTNTHPGCLGLTMIDILNVFNGDEEAMKQALYNLQLPLNIPLTDEFAPKIATYLINHGYVVGGNCTLN